MASIPSRWVRTQSSSPSISPLCDVATLEECNETRDGAYSPLSHPPQNGQRLCGIWRIPSLPLAVDLPSCSNRIRQTIFRQDDLGRFSLFLHHPFPSTDLPVSSKYQLSLNINLQVSTLSERSLCRLISRNAKLYHIPSLPTTRPLAAPTSYPPLFLPLTFSKP